MEQTVNVVKVQEASLVDGPGLRTVVWFGGCNIRCPGCQNEAYWNPRPENNMLVTELARTLAVMNGIGQCNGNGKFTITGGEPFRQLKSLFGLVIEIKRKVPHAHIIVYTGHPWETLMRWGGVARGVLGGIDILVDGPYIAEQDDDGLSYRGSRNQRVILSKQSYFGGKIVTLDWDSPAGTIHNGQITLPGEIADVLAMDTVASPRCGQGQEANDAG
jgi:anaerobic ribonucleoside-triphosphate reductase activating protein